MPEFRLRLIGWAVLVLVASSFAAAAHPMNDGQARPGDHQHYHCHHSEVCHAHTHDGAHH